MKRILFKFVIIGLLLVMAAGRGYCATYDWVGTTLTGSVYNWNNKLNWQVGGVAATTIPGAADVVQIAVNSFTNYPTITDAESCASIILGTFDNFTLTVNGTLTVSGSIIQNNDPNFYQYTVLAGTGTITCGSFQLGDNTQPNSGVGVVNNVSSQVNQLTINGNLTLNAVGNATNDGIEYPYFSLDANKITLSGQIVTTTNSNPLSNGVGVAAYPGIGLFQMGTYSTPTTLELLNNNPVVTPITSGYTVDFDNNGGACTVIYDAVSGTQAVYTTGTSGLGINNYNYEYLTFGGASKKTVIGGALTIGNDWTSGGTGAVDLSTNNPTISVAGNWINSTNITQGSGSVSITGNVQINGGTITTGTGTLTVSGLFQNNSGTLACGSGSVIFDGNYTNSGTFTAGTGTVYFSGATQTLLDNSSAGTVFNTVTFNGSGTATMSAGVNNFSVSSKGVLTMVSPANLVAGSATAAYLTLNSDATGSATVAALSGTSTITGLVNVQRYITGGSSAYRGYRLLSSPVYAATAASNNVFSLNYLKNSTYLTGTTGTAGGFDKAGNPTLYLFRENLAVGNTSFTAGNFRGINNITAAPGYSLDNETGTFNIPVGNGFLFFFRGNRSTTLAAKTVSPYSNPENTTLTSTGTLITGQVIVHDWYTPASANLGYTTTTGNNIVRGYNLVGNPYASSINWDLVQGTSTTTAIYEQSVGGTIYVMDPVSKNYGAYTAGTGGIGTHNTSNIIPSGQGFFVQTGAATAQLIFNESAKVNTQVTGVNLLMGRPADYTSNQYFQLRLAKDSVNTDDIIIHFNSSATAAYNPAIDGQYKAGSGLVSLYSLSSDNIPLAINSLPLPKTRETIGLSATVATDGSYQFQLKNIAAIPQLFDVWLIDNYTRDSTNLRETPVYNFSVVKSDTNSSGSKRFKLVISQNPKLAYRMLNFTAFPSDADREVFLKWQTVNEGNYTTFTVERSNDNGNSFNVVGGVPATGQGNYGLLDRTPQTGKNLYRLKQVDINNNTTYSKVIPVEYGGLSNTLTANNIHVYPNPAKSTLSLTISGVAKTAATNYNISITNSSGMIVKQIVSSQPNWQGNVNDLLTGTYVIQVTNSKDQSFVGKAKFVKL